MRRSRRARLVSRRGRGAAPRLSLLAWLPLVAALAVSARFARAVVAAALEGPGGSFVMPAQPATAAPVARRIRHVRRPRAPDAPENGRAL